MKTVTIILEIYECQDCFKIYRNKRTECKCGSKDVDLFGRVIKEESK